jgi:hypothetical protein
MSTEEAESEIYQKKWGVLEILCMSVNNTAFDLCLHKRTRKHNRKLSGL